MQLNRKRILDTAIEILQSYGLADLTMRRLATQLGVAPGALYWHFPNKQQLLGGVASRLMEGLDWEEKNLDFFCQELFLSLISVPSGAEITLAASASQALDPDPSQKLPPEVWHYVVGAALDFQSRQEAAQRLGMEEPAVVNVAPTVSVLLGLQA